MSTLPLSPLTPDELTTRIDTEPDPWRCLDLCHALRVRLAGGAW